MKVVILDHIRVRLRDARHQIAKEIRFCGIATFARFEHLGRAIREAHRDHEDAIALRIEARRLEIELQSVKLIEREIAEVRASGRNEVLLLRRQCEE